MRSYVQAALTGVIFIGCVTSTAVAQRNGALPGQANDIWRSKKYTPMALPDVAKMSPIERGRVVLYGYAECVVRASPRKVEAMLDLPMHSPQSTAASRRLIVDECLSGGDLTINADLVRGSLYRALYQYNYPKAQPALQPVTVDAVAGSPVAVAINYDPLRQFAECVVRDNTTASRNLVRAPAASNAEQSALDNLKPALANCMAKGSEVKFSKAVLVGLIAEMLYRLSSPALIAGSK